MKTLPLNDLSRRLTLTHVLLALAVLSLACQSPPETATPWPDVNGGDTQSPPPSIICGDSICSANENAQNCPFDCPTWCGDGHCTGSESSSACAEDCPVNCGDGVCDTGEHSVNCSADCPPWCGDGFCTNGEAHASCPADCPSNCGDGQCNPGENSGTCPSDCPVVCGDNHCSPSESTADCVQDCGSWCGDGACNGAESTTTCPTDCDANTGNGNNGGGNNPPPAPEATMARFVRIETTQTPSWVSWGEIEVLDANGTNLALGKKVTASSSTDSGPPELAVDGSPASGWNAGDFAPATITVDLGQIKAINKVRMRVAQSPPGTTVHSLEFGTTTQQMKSAHTYAGHTKSGDWLVYPPPGQSNGNNGGGTVVNPNTGNLPKGLAWTRSNPMFISALSVSIGPPTVAQTNEYFDGFNANAAHTWGKGLPDAINGWGAANHPEFRWVAWVDNHGKSLANQQVIGGVGANPTGRIGYQIGDEPGLHGDGMTELLEIEQGINAVLQADPDALTIVNFSFWAEGFLQLLEYYGGQTQGDVFSYDRYAVGYNEHETMAVIRDYALKWNRPYWRYLRSYHDVPMTAGDQGAKTHPSDMRWDAFLGLVYGYTGHTWFVYQAAAPHKVGSILYDGQGGLDKTKKPLWDTVATLNQEMRHLGRAITQLKSTDVRYKASQGLWKPDGTTAWKAGAGGDAYITQIAGGDGIFLDDNEFAVGYFLDDAGEQYVMIQNQNHKNAQWPINNTKDAELVVSFDFGNSPGNVAATHLQVLNKTTGMVENHPLTSVGAGQAQLKVTLPSGDAIFFKYDTGAPFAMGP